MNSNCVRFFLFVFALFFIVLIVLSSKTTLFIKNLDPYDFKIYCSYKIENENFNFQQNGIGYILNCNFSDFITLQDQYNYDGISFNTSCNLQDCIKLLSATIVEEQVIEDYRIVYAYTNYYEKFIVSNNKKINIQIKVCNNSCLVGMPILLGSY